MGTDVEPMDMTLYRAVWPTWASAWDAAVQDKADEAMAAITVAEDSGQHDVLLDQTFEVPWPPPVIASYESQCATFTQAVREEVHRRSGYAMEDL